VSCSAEDDGIFFEPPFTTLKTSYSDLELEIEKLINEHRSSNSIFVVTKSNTISSVAQSHSLFMAENKVVNHENFPARNYYLTMSQNAKTVGENIGYGYGTAKGIINAWLNSPKHKAIIENSTYTHMGVSMETDQKGRNYFTLIFIEKNN
jgi:uncharacterized protein YkwD